MGCQNKNVKSFPDPVQSFFDPVSLVQRANMDLALAEMEFEFVTGKRNSMYQ